MAIIQGAHRSEFEYDGMSRRLDAPCGCTAIVEIENGTVESRKPYCDLSANDEDKIAATVALLDHEYRHWTQENYYSGVVSQIRTLAPLEYEPYSGGAKFLKRWRDTHTPQSAFWTAAESQRASSAKKARNLRATGRLR